MLFLTRKFKRHAFKRRVKINNLTRNELIEIAKTYGIAPSRWRSRKNLICAIEIAIANKEAIDIIANEAKLSGIEHSGI